MVGELLCRPGLTVSEVSLILESNRFILIQGGNEFCESPRGIESLSSASRDPTVSSETYRKEDRCERHVEDGE